MVTTIELVLDIKLGTEFAPKSNHFQRLTVGVGEALQTDLEKLLGIAIG
jgi:hypothetical protein